MNGYKEGKFTNGVSFDIEGQKSVNKCLVNLFQNPLSALCPTKFNKKSVKVWDVNNIIWKTEMSVTKVRKSQRSKELTEHNLKKKEYLITYDIDGLHCVSVAALGPDKKSVIGKNSWGDENCPYPHVKFSEIVDLFKVTSLIRNDIAYRDYRVPQN